MVDDSGISLFVIAWADIVRIMHLDSSIAQSPCQMDVRPLCV